jgi:hypothetical protein
VGLVRTYGTEEFVASMSRVKIVRFLHSHRGENLKSQRSFTIETNIFMYINFRRNCIKIIHTSAS